MNHQISPNRSQYKDIKRFMAKIIFLGSSKAFDLRFFADSVYFTCYDSNTKFIQNQTVIKIFDWDGPISGLEFRPEYTGTWPKWSNKMRVIV